MGLVKESELSPETKEADSYLSIDLGYCIDGNIVSYEAVPEGVATVPENVDYPRYAEAMESHVPLPIATQIAKHDFSHRQADILMEAARNPHVSSETLETIADKTLSSGKMRGLLDIASVGKNPLDFRNMDEQTLKAAVSVLFHGGKDLPVTELDLAQLRSVDLALMDGALLGSYTNIKTLFKELSWAFDEIAPEFITVYYGKDVQEDDAQEEAKTIIDCFPDAEVSVVSGGQPVYYYMISVE